MPSNARDAGKKVIGTSSNVKLAKWFDSNEHNAAHEMFVHSDLQIFYNGAFNAMNKPEGSDYSREWEQNYEFIQGAIRLEENDRSNSNKAV